MASANSRAHTQPPTIPMAGKAPTGANSATRSVAASTTRPNASTSYMKTMSQSANCSTISKPTTTRATPATNSSTTPSSSSPATMAQKTRAKNQVDTTAVAKPTSTKAAIACPQSPFGNRATSAMATTRHPGAPATSLMASTTSFYQSQTSPASKHLHAKDLPKTAPVSRPFSPA